LKGELTINDKVYRAGDQVRWTAIYPFFLIHMAMFGGSGFFMAYGVADTPVGFLYAHGGFAIAVYLIFYLSLFGREEVKWMCINAGLGVLGIYAEMSWILSLFGRSLGDYPFYVHVIPFCYYVLYTFLVRQAVLDICGAREDPVRQATVERWYVGISLVVYVGLALLRR
jgi:hypothetical protein